MAPAHVGDLRPVVVRRSNSPERRPDDGLGDEGPDRPRLGRIECPLQLRGQLTGVAEGVTIWIARPVLIGGRNMTEPAEPGTIAAFVAEPIVGATLGAVAPPDDYWPKIAEVCRRHGALLIADEVMTGFGRTGRWFGLDHWGVRADLLVAAKGATSGYWPFGFVAASADVHDAVMGAGGFIHGFTYSHAPAGAAVAREVLRILESENLVEASATKGIRFRDLLEARLGAHPNVGEIRGRGFLIGLELVADRTTRAAFPRTARLTEAIIRGARSRGVLVYSSTGHADGVNGDLILLGPPFVVTNEELVRIVAGLAEAIEEGVASLETEATASPGSPRGAAAESPAAG